MILLVDIDGTVADWGAAYDAALETHGEAAKNIRRHSQQQSFNLHEGVEEAESAIISALMDTLDYANLEPLPGAIAALEQMLEDGHEVFLVTSPWPTNEGCASGKMSWVIKHLGIEWAQRLVIASDKTVVRGDILIDDKPEIKGHMHPTWEHVVFTQPYNVAVADRRRMDDWTNWRDIVFPRASSGMGNPETTGRCPVPGCGEHVLAISEVHRGSVPDAWFDEDGGTFEDLVHQHNQSAHA